MIKQELFICEKCGQKYQTEQQAIECELFHKEKDEILKCVEFELTEQHLKLLQKQNVKWQWREYGASEINPKRPYGNSDVEGDIAKILNIHGEEINPELSTVQKKDLWKLHIETTVALEICLYLQQFKTGKYIKTPKDWISGRWQEVTNND